MVRRRSAWGDRHYCDSTAAQDAREAEWAANGAVLLGCAALNGKNPAALKMSKSSYGRHGRWCCTLSHCEERTSEPHDFLAVRDGEMSGRMSGCRLPPHVRPTCLFELLNFESSIPANVVGILPRVPRILPDPDPIVVHQ